MKHEYKNIFTTHSLSRARERGLDVSLEKITKAAVGACNAHTINKPKVFLNKTARVVETEEFGVLFSREGIVITLVDLPIKEDWKVVAAERKQALRLASEIVKKTVVQIREKG